MQEHNGALCSILVGLSALAALCLNAVAKERYAKNRLCDSVLPHLRSRGDST